MRIELTAAAMLAGVLCMGATPVKAFFQPTLGIAAKAEMESSSRLMGDDVITAATGIPMLTILLHGAPTAVRVPTRL